MRLKIAMHPVAVVLAIACLPAIAQHPRPKITGISHLAVYSSDMAATNRYYAGKHWGGA